MFSTIAIKDYLKTRVPTIIGIIIKRTSIKIKINWKIKRRGRIIEIKRRLKNKK